MSLIEAAQALIADYDNFVPEEGSYKAAWPQMEALRDALAEAEKAEPVAWGQLGMMNGRLYLRTAYESIPYPPPADVVRNLNLVPLYAHPPAALPESALAELTTEQMRALRESHAFDAEWRYFEPRPVSDSATSRKAFADGFDRGWDAALAAARGKG